MIPAILSQIQIEILYTLKTLRGIPWRIDFISKILLKFDRVLASQAWVFHLKRSKMKLKKGFFLAIEDKLTYEVDQITFNFFHPNVRFDLLLLATSDTSPRLF